MILTHGTNSLKRGGGGGGSTVNIGGRDYPYVKIGNQYWLAENLDYRWDGANVTNDVIYGDNTVSRLHYNPQHPEYGTKYNCFSTQDVDNRVTSLGWRVPTESDFNTLIAFIGGVSQGIKLKSTTSWGDDPRGKGTDDYGFNAKNYPWYLANYNSNPGIISDSTAFMSKFITYQKQRYISIPWSNYNNIINDTNYGSYGFATFAYIRLCKDI